ncbi:HAD family hydrolase [Halomonas sp. A29]|uniref:HAD family hydrolase n=1 Tax=Halomonas sp. A29 TaxID=3102786 RepID=UPI00398B9DA7
MPIRALLFDHDGTLVDSEPVHFHMWERILADHGVTLLEETYIAQYAGKPTTDNAKDMVERFHLERPHQELAAKKSLVTQRRLDTEAFPLRPAVKEVIDFCHAQGLMLGVVTGAGRNGVEATLRHNGLHRHFATVVSGDDVTASKPAPDVYLLALERLGIAASECFAIEDTEHGVSAATAAGISCIAIPNRMTRQHDFSAATTVLENFDELFTWLETAQG